MFKDLTYRFKIPIRGTVLILITAAAIAAALIYRAAEDLRDDMVANAESMSRVLARTLEPALRRDDVWMAYKIVTSPTRQESDHSRGIAPESILVVDDQDRIFVATAPRRFPMLTPLAKLGDTYGQLPRANRRVEGGDSPVIETDPAGRLHMLTPIVSDGITIGALIVTYPGDVFAPRIARFAARAALITLLVLAVLVPVSWYWGARMAKPLVQLANCLGRIGPNIPEDLSCSLEQSKDELGRVATQFQRMLKELKEKQAIESQMIAAERLAAVGRLTAGIAHEINNPLGGMLNALNTFRRYGAPDDLTQRTVSLLERGLLQIRETVSALLVEAKPESRELTHDDLDDVRTLVGPSLQRKSADLIWDNRIEGPFPISATLVRQVVINLVLNAAHAIPFAGHIHVGAAQEGDELLLTVGNDGDAIPRETIGRLFEPFASGRPDGTGLGLWVSYQIIQQLGGHIAVRSEPGSTQFTVRLPLSR